jgi:leader peptidase (prepilin peptidase)/N-methyltransferase
MLLILVTVFAALFGLAFGSFLNLCITRWPKGESIAFPRSHCRKCNRTLYWWENIPLGSWVALRGRCRTCRRKIGWRYPIVEAAVAICWAICAWNSFPVFGSSLFVVPTGFLLQQLGNVTLCWLLVGLATLDSENLWLPDFLTLPGIAAGLLLTTARELLDDHLDRAPRPWHALMSGVVAALAAAALILLVRWIYWLIRRQEGIGLGDAKLMAMLAAWLGLPGALLAFFIGVILGALVALTVVISSNVRHAGGVKLPLGTFLCIGGIVSVLWGQPILDTYLRWAGF